MGEAVRLTVDNGSFKTDVVLTPKELSALADACNEMFNRERPAALIKKIPEEP